MVPATYTVLDALPLTSNGKVDRRALPSPGVAESAALTDASPPRAGLEREIAGLIQGVLGRESIGRNENFFELGGTSVQMVQFHYKLQEALGRDDIPITALFNQPSIRALAQHLSQDAVAETTPDNEQRQASRTSGKARMKQRLKKRNRRRGSA
ncbi:MAG: phosphopantetheine-binding protein [Acidobacteriota bacterium]